MFVLRYSFYLKCRFIFKTSLLVKYKSYADVIYKRQKQWQSSKNEGLF